MSVNSSESGRHRPIAEVCARGEWCSTCWDPP